MSYAEEKLIHIYPAVYICQLKHWFTTHYKHSLLPVTVHVDSYHNHNDGRGIHLWSGECELSNGDVRLKISRIHPTKIQVRHSNIQTSPTNSTDLQPTLGEDYISKADCMSTHFITLMMKEELGSEHTDVF